MNGTLGVLGISTALVVGLSSASVAADDPPTVAIKDRAHDVRTEWPHHKEEKAPRFIKRSVDIEHVRYAVKQHARRPHIRVTYKVRNVLKASRRRNQGFRTHFSDSIRYSFASFKSVGHGPVKVSYFGASEFSVGRGWS